MGRKVILAILIVLLCCTLAYAEECNEPAIQIAGITHLPLDLLINKFGLQFEDQGQENMTTDYISVFEIGSSLGLQISGDADTILVSNREKCVEFKLSADHL